MPIHPDTPTGLVRDHPLGDQPPERPPL